MLTSMGLKWLMRTSIPLRVFIDPQVYTSIAQHPLSGNVWMLKWLSAKAYTIVTP